MSASSNAIWRGCRSILQAFGLLPKASSEGVKPQQAFASASSIALPAKLYATIEIITTPTLPDSGAPVALPTPALAQNAAPQTTYRPAFARPLASQLAFTASRNVPKGRKPARAAKKVTSSKPSQRASLPLKASVIKAKPVIAINAKKRAPKRRHVWMSNQSRVIRSISTNVVTFAAAPRTQRNARSGNGKVVRLLKLAA